MQEQVIRLSPRDTKTFLATLDNPLPPNADLKAALDHYAARRNDQTGALDWTPSPKRV